MIYYFFNIIFKLPKKNIIKQKLKKLIIKKNFYIGNINYIFCNDKYLLSINKKYLLHNFFTDIITFDYVKNKIISGDIFISVERVKDNSLIWKQSFESEIHRVMIHGILHLLGYKDTTLKQKKIMRLHEDFYLNLLYKKNKHFK